LVFVCLMLLLALRLGALAPLLSVVHWYSVWRKCKQPSWNFCLPFTIRVGTGHWQWCFQSGIHNITQEVWVVPVNTLLNTQSCWLLTF
jgi:hypothetical protein